MSGYGGDDYENTVLSTIIKQNFFFVCLFIDDLINAGYSEPGAIPVATPVPMYDDNTTGMYQHETKMVIASEPVMAATSTTIMNNEFSQLQKQQQIQQQTFVLADPTLSRGPMMMRRCPNCQQESRTRVTTCE